MVGQGQRVLKNRIYFSKMNNYGKRYSHSSLTTSFATPKVLTALLMRIPVLWDVTLCHLVSDPDVSEGSSVIFNGQVVQEERCMTFEYESTAFF